MNENTFFGPYVDMWKNYVNFTGKTSRRGFWMAILVDFLIGIIFGVISAILPIVGGILSTIYALAIIIPSIALWVRRLHDTGRSGWWFLLCLIPLVGLIILIVWACQPSK